jgi:hypothetical protein
VISGYLLDTNALSILAPPSTPGSAATSDGAVFRAWVREHDEELFLSVITLAEIQAGVPGLNVTALQDAPRTWPIGSMRSSSFISPALCRSFQAPRSKPVACSTAQ